jgi:hypothetical protein
MCITSIRETKDSAEMVGREVADISYFEFRRLLEH